MYIYKYLYTYIGLPSSSYSVPDFGLPISETLKLFIFSVISTWE